MTVSDLKPGQVIMFTKTAPGSYLGGMEKVRVVAVDRTHVHFRNYADTCGTFDSKSLLRLACFELA